MFEKYNEQARRAIFFARHEATVFESPYIETEHLLLGLLREDKGKSNPFLGSRAAVESILKRIERHTTKRDKILCKRENTTTIDLPLSHDCKRVLAFTAEEAERLSHKRIGKEHILLGLLREEKCFAAVVLRESGLMLSTVREEVTRTHSEDMAFTAPKETPLLSDYSRDLTQAAGESRLYLPVGRDNELTRMVQILSRRDKNNPVLIGEPGVGKTAIVEGLAAIIADGDVPLFLSDKRILALDLPLIVAGTKYRGQFEERLKTIRKELMEYQNAIIFFDDLPLVGAGSLEEGLDIPNVLKSALSSGEIQSIATTTPSGYRKMITMDPWFAHCFRAVNVPPLNELGAIQVLYAIKDRYEGFHAVVYTAEALQYAVYYSKRYISDRFLPATAIDVIDEAGARVKVRQSRLPAELSDAQKRIKFITHRMEHAIANHEFEKAKFYSDEERKARVNLRLLREKHNIEGRAFGIVTREDIEVVVSDWAGMPVTYIRIEEPAADDPTAPKGSG